MRQARCFGLGAPRNAPPRFIDRLNKEINAALADLRASRSGCGLPRSLDGTALGGSPADSASSSRRKPRNGAMVIRLANIKPDEVDNHILRRIGESSLAAAKRRSRTV